MKWRVYLRLGRVSNLPTVWSNTLAGMTLAGRGDEVIGAGGAALLALAFSCFYVGGMFLNDAFDRRIDARERPERPIPAGLVGAGEVFVIGFGLLGAGMLTLALHGRVTVSGYDGRVLASGAALALAIVVYDLWHKRNPLSPWLMGICRVLVYVTAALAVSGSVERSVQIGAALLLAYLVGLTFVAKQENLAALRNRWPLVFLFLPFAATWRPHGLGAVLYALFGAWVTAAAWRLWRARSTPGGRGLVPRVVVRLIAGMSLLDALLMAEHGSPWPALAAVAAFGFTLLGQRWIAGT
jgi:4-hydroxybenzoate polyprenyltransferase